MAALDELGHVAEEEGEQQGADVRAVDVGVGHEDELAVAEARGVEVFLADAAAEGGDHGADFLVAEHLVVACFFDVEDLAFEREDGLEFAVAALLGGAAGGFALDEVELAAVGLALGAVGEFAWQPAAVERAFATGQVAGLACGFAGACGFDGLVDDLAGDLGVAVEKGAEALVDEGLDGAGDVGVELALGLAFELGLREFDGDDDDEAFADVVAGEAFLVVLEEAEGFAGGVDGAGEGGFEAGEMGAAVDGVDVVGEGEDGLGVGVVVLEGDLHGDVVALGLHVDGLLVEDGLALVEELDELGDAAGVLEGLGAGFAGLGVGGALVGEGDLDALVEEGELAEAVGEGVVVVFVDGEDGFVGQEVDLGAFAGAGAHLAQEADGFAFAVVLLPGVAVAPDLDVEGFGQGVDAGDADAVEAARDFVVGGVEFAAGVEHGEDDLDGGHGDAVDGLVVDGDAAAVVDDGDGVVDVDGDVDAGGVAAERFVDGVVDDFVDEVVQALLAGGADVHGGAQADGGEAFEDGDVFRGVAAAFFGGGGGSRDVRGGVRVRRERAGCQSVSVERVRNLS